MPLRQEARGVSAVSNTGSRMITSKTARPTLSSTRRPPFGAVARDIRDVKDDLTTSRSAFTADDAGIERERLLVGDCLRAGLGGVAADLIGPRGPCMPSMSWP